MKKKRSQSELITSILLILLAIALISIIFAVVIPMVRNNLNKSKECYELTGKISFDNSLGLICYDRTNKKLDVTVHYGDAMEEKIKGFVISVMSNGSSKAFRIDSASVEDVFMYGGIGIFGNASLTFPGNNEEKTYSMNMSKYSEPQIIELYAVAKSGNLCEGKLNTMLIERC